MSSSKLEAGKKPPSFTLADQDGRKVSLRNLSGQWVVLYFYPKDDTPGCTTEACEFTAGIKEFKAAGAVIVGCSPDSPEDHRKFIAKHKLKVMLLSDPDHSVMKAFGAYGEKMMYGRKVTGVIRSTVLIAPDGKVAHHWATVRAAGHAAAVAAKLEGLRQTPATAPGSWPGLRRRRALRSGATIGVS